jgi:hypothetical protein
LHVAGHVRQVATRLVAGRACQVAKVFTSPAQSDSGRGPGLVYTSSCVNGCLCLVDVIGQGYFSTVRGLCCWLFKVPAELCPVAKGHRQNKGERSDPRAPQGPNGAPQGPQGPQNWSLQQTGPLGTRAAGGRLFCWVCRATQISSHGVIVIFHLKPHELTQFGYLTIN